MHFIYSHLLFGIIPIICLYFLDDSRRLSYIIAILVINLVLFFFLRYEYPSYLTITDDNKIIFDKKSEIISFWGRPELVRATIILSFIEDIKIIQNPFERLFGMCHICLYGSPDTTTVSSPMIAKYRYVFYGMNYKKAKRVFEGAFLKEQWK